jgi:hypothetical protein
MKTNKISITDFQFSFVGYGRYMVTYISPVTKKKYSHSTNDMPLIDATKNADGPKQVDLIRLKRICKQTH